MERWRLWLLKGVCAPRVLVEAVVIMLASVVPAAASGPVVVGREREMDEDSQVAGYAAADLETNWLEGPPDSEGGGWEIKGDVGIWGNCYEKQGAITSTSPATLLA